LIGLVLLVVGMVSLTLLGILAILPMKGSLRPAEFIALAFGVGSGTATLCFFIVSAVGVTLSCLTMGVVLAAAVLALSAFRLLRKGDLPSIPRLTLSKPSIARLDALLIFAMGSVFLGAAVIAVYWPPYTWDALAIWVAKARAIAVSQTIAAIQYGGAHEYYPLHLPLQLSFFTQLGGVALAKAVFPLYYASLLVLFAAGLTRVCHRSVALGFTLLLATVPFLLLHATIAYADLTFAFFYVGGTLLLHRFTTTEDSTGNGELLVLGGVLLGIASWTRPEGPIYFVFNSVMLVALSLRRRIGLTSFAKYGTAWAAFALPWLLYTRAMGYHNSLFQTAASSTRQVLAAQVDWARIHSILVYLGRQMVDTGTWGWLWIVFLAALILYPGKAKVNAFLVGVIGLNMLGLVLQYYVAPASGNPLSWWLTTGFNRMALHFAPLLVFYSALCFDEDLVSWLTQARRLMGLDTPARSAASVYQARAGHPESVARHSYDAPNDIAGDAGEKSGLAKRDPA
jgi:hypothetical protein